MVPVTWLAGESTASMSRARRLELGTVSAEPLSRAYWSQKLRPLGETVGLSRARTSGESPDSTQAGRGPQWPIQLAAISAHPAAMVGTAMPKLRGRSLVYRSGSTQIGGNLRSTQQVV